MTVIYIIGGILCLVLAIYFLDKREKMSHDIKDLKAYKQEIEDTNQQLDELQEQLNSIHEPLMKMSIFAKKILGYMK